MIRQKLNGMTRISAKTENDEKAGALMKKGKQIWCVCIAAVLCFSLCGCRLDELIVPEIPSTAPTTTTTTLPSVDVPMTLLGNGYAYSTLDEVQQENYEAVVKTLYEKRGQDTTVEEQYGLSVTLPHFLQSEEEMEQLVTAVYDDHPEFFYLTSQYGWVTLGKSYTTVRFYYIWDADERAARGTELEAAVSSLVTQAQGLSTMEQELLFHDALTKGCEYNEVAAQEIDSETLSDVYYAASSPYAALCSGDPICGGYSRAFQLLLSRVGIPNTAINNDDHTWTMVWLEDAAYHVDVTWDDPTEGEEQYLYLNITDEEIRATRDYPAQSRTVPEATATEYNYYVMNGWYFTDAFDEELDDCICEQIASGKEAVELKFAPDAFIDAGSWLFDDEAFFDAVYELEDDTLRDRWYSEVFYEEDEELGTMKIYLEE